MDHKAKECVSELSLILKSVHDIYLRSNFISDSCNISYITDIPKKTDKALQESFTDRKTVLNLQSDQSTYSAWFCIYPKYRNKPHVFQYRKGFSS